MANRFRSYLLEEAIRTLAADGSRHLKELSGGRYTFHTEGAEFQIVDGWNADERRSVKTLSGGETFLASLALALGLAEGIASARSWRARPPAPRELVHRRGLRDSGS